MNYDKEKYKIWKLPHPMVLHWVINPGLAINELLLGQRLPKVTLIDQTSDKPLLERQYVPCPSCSTLNDARLWSKGNAFGHWFGLICPNCHKKIPTLWNITSLLVLALTFPIWIFIKIFAEKAWLEREKRKFTEVTADGLPTEKEISWVKMGFGFGALMFCFMSLPMFFNGSATPKLIATQIVVWLIAGALFGLTMKFFMTRRK